MSLSRVFAAALLSAVACAAETPVAGKWNCTNLPSTGAESPWTLIVSDDGTKLGGVLTDGDVKIPLSQIKLDQNVFTFRFDINEKPYDFSGKLNGTTLEGKYSGDEASGTLRCVKP